MLSLSTQENFRRFITPHIKQLCKELKYKGEFSMDRITVWADTDMYKWKEDELIWNQKKGNIPTTYQVFVDSRFVCYLDNNTSKKIQLAMFWKGFLEAYSLPDDDKGKIFLDKSNYKVIADKKEKKRQKQQEEILKAIDDKPVTNETEAEAKEIAKHVTQTSTTS